MILRASTISAATLTGDKVLKVFAGIARKNIRKCDQWDDLVAKNSSLFLWIAIHINPCKFSKEYTANSINTLSRIFPFQLTFSAGLFSWMKLKPRPRLPICFWMLTDYFIKQKAKENGRAISASGEFLFNTGEYQDENGPTLPLKKNKHKATKRTALILIINQVAVSYYFFCITIDMV
jgi:hypothetical protein